MPEIYLPLKSECMPPKNMLFARTGYRYDRCLEDPKLLLRANELFLEGLKHIDPKIYFDIFPLEVLPRALIPDSFESALRVSVFLSTLGRVVEERINEYAGGGSVFDAYLLDSWASESLETLNKGFDQKLREINGRGTMRFSPGYGKVDIRMNGFIVSNLLGVDSVTVLKSGVISPRKSTICMIGWLA